MLGFTKSVLKTDSTKSSIFGGHFIRKKTLPRNKTFLFSLTSRRLRSAFSFSQKAKFSIRPISLQSIFTHARQRIQAGEELQLAQSSMAEPELESDEEAGSDGEEDEDEVCDNCREIVSLVLTSVDY